VAGKQLRLDEKSLLGAGQRLLLIANFQVKLRKLIVGGDAQWVELDELLDHFDGGIDLASFNKASGELLTDLWVRRP
jgi:hypothetical protein